MSAFGTTPLATGVGCGSGTLVCVGDGAGAGVGVAEGGVTAAWAGVGLVCGLADSVGLASRAGSCRSTSVGATVGGSAATCTVCVTAVAAATAAVGVTPPGLSSPQARSPRTTISEIAIIRCVRVITLGSPCAKNRNEIQSGWPRPFPINAPESPRNGIHLALLKSDDAWLQIVSIGLTTERSLPLVLWLAFAVVVEYRCGARRLLHQGNHN